MLVWQDSFLSLTYDRPPSTINSNLPIPFTPNAEGLPFQDSIFSICKIILERTRLEMSSDSEFPPSSALDSKKKLEGLWGTVSPFLRERSRCTSLQQNLERLALGVHLGYTICRFTWIYVESAKQYSLPFGDIEDCARHAMLVIENFLGLHRFSAGVCRSWAFVHNTVSCAMTLKSLDGMLPERNPRLEILLQRLIAVLEKEERESEWIDADTNVRHFGLYSRALKALRETL